MQSQVREKLCEIVARYGTEIHTDVRRCTALLHDLCGQHRREINVLHSAMRVRIPAALLNASPQFPHIALVAQLTRRLSEDMAMKEEAAHWAVLTWAIALRIIDEEDAEKILLQTASMVSDSTGMSSSAGERKRDRSGRTLGQEIKNLADGAVLLWVGDGEANVGDSDQRDNPARKVNLPGFWVYKNPVTVAQFKLFCDEDNVKMPPPPPWGWHDDHPIVNVTWKEAKRYADWADVTLPSEVYWEKAARGTDARLFPWGNAWEEYRCANSIGRRRNGTAPIESFPKSASPCGALDMAGNVWEWCEDIYTENPQKPPTSPQENCYRVLRGGSWSDTMNFFYRTSTRFRYSPESRFASIGFRCIALQD